MERILMNAQERRRLEVFSRIQSGEMQLVEASELLGLSYRQTKRIWSRYQQQGDAGLVHKGRGRPSNRQPQAGVRERALSLYQEHCADYGPTLAAEYFEQDHALKVPVSTLRRWLAAAGLWERKRKRKAHRRRRDRRSRAGDLLQLDGSHHDWFEGRRQVVDLRDAYSGWAILMVMIDDATSRVYARFYENESWESAADVFVRYVGQQGLPRSLYVDQHGIYRADWEPTKAEILAGKQPETQFGRAMRELEVELILAHSPQAKGRVERMNGTLQDRLVKAMRRAGINDLKTANEFLEETFLPEFNIRFSKKASQGGNLHRRLGVGIDLGRILSVQETRVLQNDWTVRWRNQVMQLPRESADWLQPKQRVTLCEQLDGRVRIFAGDREVSWTGVRDAAGPAKPKKARLGPTGSSQGQKPSANHPWRGKGRQEGEEIV